MRYLLAMLFGARSLSLAMLLGAAPAGGMAVSKKLARFNSMIDGCRLPGSTITCVDSASMRTLLRGVRAAADDTAVRTAFATLYEDFGPVRFGGDLIFRQLAKASVVASERVSALPAAEDLSVSEDERLAALSRARRLFELLDADGSGKLEPAELRSAPELLELLREPGDADEDGMLARIMAADENADGELSFVEFARGNMNRLAAADELPERAGEGAAPGRQVARQAKLDARFDEMVIEFAEWEALCTGEIECELDDPDGAGAGGSPSGGAAGSAGPAGEGRLERVLNGCFQGAKIPELVDALRLVYTQYAALRIGGDLVYKLMSKTMNQKKRRAEQP